MGRGHGAAEVQHRCAAGGTGCPQRPGPGCSGHPRPGVNDHVSQRSPGPGVAMRRCCRRAPRPRRTCNCRFWAACRQRAGSRVVAFEQDAVHAIGDVDHQQGRLHRSVGWWRRWSYRVAVALRYRLHPQTQACRTQGTVRPGKRAASPSPGRSRSANSSARCGVSVAASVRAVMPLGVSPGGNVQPAREGRGFAMPGCRRCCQPVGCRGWRQVAKRLVAWGYPAARGEVFPGRQWHRAVRAVFMVSSLCQFGAARNRCARCCVQVESPRSAI